MRYGRYRRTSALPMAIGACSGRFMRLSEARARAPITQELSRAESHRTGLPEMLRNGWG